MFTCSFLLPGMLLKSLYINLRGCLLLLVFYGMIVSCIAQPASVQSNIDRHLPKPLPASPNVASLGKFGDYKVSYFTGVPDISIPVFEAKSGTLSVPITLSYHPSGVKPTDVASWVGMGWALSAGGQISRSIRGQKDETNYYLNSLQSNPAVCGPAGTGSYNYLLDVVKGIRDTDPDAFSYSYPGDNGHFLLPYGEAPFLIPAKPILINPFAFEKFEIRNEKGILYQYGVGANSTESSTSYSGGSSSNGVNAWYLTSMTAPNSDDQISFAYQDVGLINTHDISYTQTITDQCYASNGASCPAFSLPQQINVDSYGSQRGIQTILFENGKVEFKLAAGFRNDAGSLHALETIKVYSAVNGTYTLMKTIEFKTSYFKDASGGDSKLKLDAVYFKDNADVVVQQYKFSYFTNTFSWNPTSNFLNMRDLWGYYNGASQNTDLILPTTIDYSPTTSSTPYTISFGGASNRNVNPQYVKEGVLSRIDFPTGGFTEFDYESNRYLDGTSKLVGGLRVTKITSTAGAGALPMIKTYRYGSGESGYGTPNYSLQQYQYNSTQLYYSDCDIHGPALSYRARTYYSNSAYSLNAFDSSPMFYNNVTEYLGDANGTFLGKTVYEFDNGIAIPDGVDQIVPNSGKSYKPSFGWSRGKLTMKSVYGITNNLISQTSIQYDLYKGVSGKIIGLGVHQYIEGNNFCSTTSGNICYNQNGEQVNPFTFFSKTYTQNTGAYLESMVTEMENDTGSPNFITTHTAKVYHANTLQLKQTSVDRSNDPQQTVTVNTYPFELAATSSSTGNAQGIYMLNTKNILDTPVETFSYLQNTDGSGQRVTSGLISTFRQNVTNVDQVVPDQIYILQTKLPVDKTSYTAVSVNSSNDGLVMNSNFKPRIKMNTYDSYGNLLDLSKTDEFSTTYLYGYTHSLPVAAVKNALASECRYENFEELAPSAVIINSSSAKTGKQYYLGDYTTSFTPPNTKSYKVDYWYLDTGSKWQFISKPYSQGMVLQEGSAIDDVRIYPQAAQMTSYVYDPLLGFTAVADGNGKMTFYEYDSFGRLKLIRDADLNIVKTYDYHYRKQ